MHARHDFESPPKLTELEGHATQDAPLDAVTSLEPDGHVMHVEEVDRTVPAGQVEPDLQAEAPVEGAVEPGLHFLHACLEPAARAEFLGHGLQPATEVVPAGD